VDNIENILVVIDPTTDRDFVVDRAKSLALSYKASVTFFINNANTLSKHSYSYEGIDSHFFETQKKLFVDHYKQLLDELIEEFQNAEIEASGEFSEHHHLAEAIIKQATVTNPDLVLKSTHHHSTLNRALVSNTDWRLIRKCPYPLLLVKNNDWQTDGSIVTAVDPFHAKAEQSRLDHMLVESAEQFAATLNQPACVFHCYFPFVSSMFPLGGTATTEHLVQIRQQHFEKLQLLLQPHKIEPSNVRLAHGELVPTLLQYLEQVKANMLVIGALSRNVLERAIIGNTAEKILDDCPCDVLILKP